MKKLTYLSLLFLLFAIISACEDENFNKDFGQYGLAINYDGNDPLELYFKLDGGEAGTLLVKPKANPTYVTDCKNLKKEDNLLNVFVLKEVTVGKHTLEIKTSEGVLIKTLEFEMINRECVFQDTILSFN
ncbi:hypothetical protein [Pedobacter xixiisoli]|uniref:Lipoprotein n=1 Tax=Pedobacter xixiisoli TaxID=1476464 RepID=A0A285ZXT6_9SPHI|nr:hypothetical protein [Pedobacter xixiisoli]SOD14459.1 hypothetical protein SAMN06297358_1585 [Pedobacter xixiisoli]